MGTDVTISARISESLSEQIDRLAAATRRSRSWLVEDALRRYIEEQAWQVQAIQEALDDYRSGNAELVAHEEVMREMEAFEAEIEAELK